MVTNPVYPSGEIRIMRGFHLAVPRRLLRGLMIGSMCAVVGCGEGGGSSGNADPKRGEEMKQRKLDSMKEIVEKKQGKQGARGSP
jgi:hypothetical protein